jgi:hypothetical protein
MTHHYDGTDVLVLDACGRPLPAVAEVRIDFDRAVVAISDARAWIGALRAVHAGAAPAYTIHSARDGRVHWSGPVRLAMS